MAARDDIVGILNAEELSPQVKLNFIEYMYGTLRPLNQTQAQALCGTVITLTMEDTLKASTIALLLKVAPPSQTFFEVIRRWHLGTLSEITDIEGAGAGAFATWYTNFHELYYSFTQHMTVESIRREKLLIAANSILPETAKGNIRGLLETRERELELGNF
jgi:hypothetical protein